MTTGAKVVVIGAGLAGLAAAARLVERRAEVVVVEASARLGGQIHSIVDDAVMVELGAEGFVARSQVVPKLCADLGLGDRLVDQLTTLTFAATAERLEPLAPGEAARRLGFQVPKAELGRGIRSLVGGMSELIDALSTKLAEPTSNAVIYRETPAASIETTSNKGYAIRAGERLIDAVDGVVLAGPVPVAVRLLEPMVGAAARALMVQRRMSGVTVTMEFERRHVAHSLEGSGIIVPGGEQVDGFRACSFVTSKFERSMPEGRVLLRGFFRPSSSDLAELEESVWADRAVARVRELLTISGPCRRSWVSTWQEALPVHDEPYREAVAQLEQALRSERIVLCGSHFHGAGIDAAVLSAELAAQTLAP